MTKTVANTIKARRVRGDWQVIVGDQVIGRLDPQVSGGWVFLPGRFWDELHDLPFWAREATGTYRTQREVLSALSSRRRRMTENRLADIETSVEKIDQAINGTKKGRAG